MPLLNGHRRRAQDVEVARQPHRHHRAAGGDVRQDAADPGRAARVLVRPPARGGPPAGVGPRDAKRALARALVDALPLGRGRGGGRGRLRPACSSRTSCPRRSRRSSLAATGTVHLPEVIATRSGGSRSEARRMLAQGGVQLDGEPWRRTPLDVPAAALDGRVLQLGKRQFRRLRIASRTRPCAAARPLLLLPAPRWSASSPPRGVPTSGRCARLHCPLGSPELRKRQPGGIPSSRGAAVFENSTACTSVAPCHRMWSRFDPARRRYPAGQAVACQASNQAVQQYPVKRPGRLCVLAGPRVAH